MILNGKCKEDFDYWRFEIKKYKRDNYVLEYNDIVIESLIEEWLNSNNIYLIPNPITGPKNGYDSFPIIGWRIDILETNRDTTNSFYMGYPVLDWFILEGLEIGDSADDINQTIHKNIRSAKMEAIEKINKNYNMKK